MDTQYNKKPFGVKQTQGLEIAAQFTPALLINKNNLDYLLKTSFLL